MQTKATTLVQQVLASAVYCKILKYPYFPDLESSMSHMLRLSLVGLVVFTLSGFVGCGPPSGIQTAAVHGTITVNGQPVEGVEVQFVPEAKMRPSIGLTNAKGHYEAEFVSRQSGVPLGPCIVKLSIYRGETLRNYLPAEFNEKSHENPDFKLDVPKSGLQFDYDIKYDGEIPPFKK